jgi:hypothetical protein
MTCFVNCLNKLYTLIPKKSKLLNNDYIMLLYSRKKLISNRKKMYGKYLLYRC